MKKKLYFLAIIMCILGGFNLSNLNAQTQTVTIGSGTQDNYSLPIEVYYSYSFSQQSYTKTEIAEAGGYAGTITSLAFKTKNDESSAGSRKLKVFLTNIDTENETTFAIAKQYYNLSDLSGLVYEGTVNFVVSSWNTIEFQTPFVYNGNHLLVTILDNTGSSQGDIYFEVHQKTSYDENGNAISWATNTGGDTALDPTNMTYSTPNGVRNNIQLTFEGGGEAPEPEPDPSTPLSATITADNEQICENETIQFNVNATGGSGSYSYSWTPTDGLSDPTSASPTLSLDVTDAFNFLEYTCTVTDNADNTQTKTVSKQVTIYGIPEAKVVQNNITINYGETATLSGMDPGVGYGWEWQPANKLYVEGNDYPQYLLETTTIQLEETTDFTLSLYNQYSSSCRSETTVTVEVVGRPLSVAVSADKETIYTGEKVQLTATASGGSGSNYTYSWSPATGLDNATSATPTFTPTATGTYTFTCTVSDGAETKTAEVTITVKDFSGYCEIEFILTDTYGDGWNGGNLTVVASDGTNKTLTLNSGSTATYTLDIKTGSDVTVTYTAGNYSYENKYTIKYKDGDNIRIDGSGSSDNYTTTFITSCGPQILFLTASADKECIPTDESVQLTATAQNGTGNYNYSWSPATGLDNATSATPIFRPSAAGTYTFTCTVDDGETTATDDITITVYEKPNLAKQYRIKVSTSSHTKYGQYFHINSTEAPGDNTNVIVNTSTESNNQIFTLEDAGNGNYYLRSADGYYIKCGTESPGKAWNVYAYSTTEKTPIFFDYVDGSNFYLRDSDKAGDNYFKVENGKIYCNAPSSNTDVVTWTLEEVIELDPVIPTGLTATAITSKTIDLSWDAAENAKSYNVYQDGELVSNVQGTSFKVEGLEPSTDYCFTVTSVNITKESNHSEKECVTTNAPIRPDAPADLEITVNGIAITLTWSEVDNAESYNVYQGETKISSGITNPIFTIGGLNENTRYCYTVTAVADKESEHSDELCAKTQEMGGEEGETEEIAGTGSSFNNNLPIYSGATGKYSMSQQYYTKDEINNTGGNITSISYYVYANASLTHNLEIYLNNVDEFGFEMDNMYQSPCRQVSANDLVFVGDVTFPSGEGWVEIKLGKPFMYTGNHILVTVVDNTPSTIGKAFYTRLFEKENCTGYYNSGNSIDPTINSYQMMIMSIRNDIRFTFAAAAPTIEFINNGDWNTAGNWNTGAVPSTTDDVIIKANATINSNVEVKHLSVEGGSLTIESGSLTVADIMVNNYAEDLIIKDGAQLFQGYDKVKGTFVMDINNPSEWSKWNKTGWQFIASPFTNADVDQFTSADVYDLYKFEGDSLTEEWRNHKAATANFDTVFVSGRGYMASYKNDTTATLSGTFNNATSISYPVTYQDINEGKPHWPNFHLLGNPFTFDMDLSKLSMTNMATGVAMVNDGGTYDYLTLTSDNTIKVGDGFFVKSVGPNPLVSYSVATRGSNDDNTSENISVKVSNSTSRDNVVLNFAGSDKAGFPKLNAFNEDAAYLYVVSEEQRYGIFNYDKDINEVPLSFETQKMSRYTISIDAEGEYESIVLVDRRTGIETNMLLEDYSFTATTSTKENTDRFLVRFTFKSDVEAETETFAYQSGDELIINAEGTVQLFDVTGRILYVGDVASHGERINVGHLNNAAYILRLVNEEGVKVQKVIIY